MFATLLAAALLTFTTTPSNCFEPCELRARITITEPERTYAICIHVDGAGLERHSCWPPAGKTNETRISNIPEGTYAVWATASLQGGVEVATSKRTLTVIGERGWREEDGY